MKEIDKHKSAKMGFDMTRNAGNRLQDYGNGSLHVLKFYGNKLGSPGVDLHVESCTTDSVKKLVLCLSREQYSME